MEKHITTEGKIPQLDNIITNNYTTVTLKELSEITDSLTELIENTHRFQISTLQTLKSMQNEILLFCKENEKNRKEIEQLRSFINYYTTLPWYKKVLYRKKALNFFNNVTKDA